MKIKSYKLYLESIYDHLLDRGIDKNKTRIIVDEKSGDVFFYLYNLSGKLIGYQKYNPSYKKINTSEPKLAKYFTWISEEGYGKYIGVWGLESISIKDKYLFITEGVFDSARIHEAGYPSIAVLCNNPSDSMKGWLKTLPQTKIVIYDNDGPGHQLIKVGDYAYTVPSGKDINDLTPDDAKNFIQDCLYRSGLSS